jgi:hypothetical protein
VSRIVLDDELAALDLNELRKRDARTRLLLGFYVTAKQRGERLEESAASGHAAG